MQKRAPAEWSGPDANEIQFGRSATTCGVSSQHAPDKIAAESAECARHTNQSTSAKAAFPPGDRWFARDALGEFEPQPGDIVVSGLVRFWRGSVTSTSLLPTSFASSHGRSLLANLDGVKDVLERVCVLILLHQFQINPPLRLGDGFSPAKLACA